MYIMSEYNFQFKEKFSFETRQAEANKILTKYPNRIPIILEKSHTSKTIPDVDKKKYLVPQDLSMGQFQYVVRKRLKTLTSEQGPFFFVGNAMPAVGQLLSQVYSEHKDEDGFLYVIYAGENTFG